MTSFLRNLGVDQQIGLLFVLLFGLLALASVAMLLLSLRERRQADGSEDPARLQRQRDNRNLLRVSWVMATVFWLGWAAGEGVATVLFGLLSFFALREFIGLSPTRRSDHRSLVLAFFVVLPLQYLLVWSGRYNLFTVFIPVYVFLALPVASALAGDPQRFLERNAKIQWGIMVCIYGLGHAPALVLLDFPGHGGRGAFLLFFLVVVTVGAQLAQTAASRRLRRRPVARHIDRSFSLRAWGIGIAAGAALGLALFWITPFKPGQALPWPPSPQPPARWANW